MARRKHKRLVQQAELDITAFMNLMIVLVPVLLLSMVFAHTAVLDLNFPPIDESQPLPDNEETQLQIIIRANHIAIADSKLGLITRIDALITGQDFDSLSRYLKSLKARFPDKTDITILLEQNIDYQTLVTTMDTTRSYPAVVAASLVDAELFPDISIGDAPSLAASGGQL